MIEPFLAFFKGDEFLALACILPLAVVVVVGVMKTLTKLTVKAFGSRKFRKEQYVDTEYHKEITSELFVPPTQIDTPY